MTKQYIIMIYKITFLVILLIAMTPPAATAQDIRTIANGPNLYIKDATPGFNNMELVTAYQDQAFSKGLGLGFYNNKAKTFTQVALSKTQALDVIAGKPLDKIAGLIAVKAANGSYYKQTNSEGIITYMIRKTRSTLLITVGLPQGGPQTMASDNGPMHGPLTEAQTKCADEVAQELKDCLSKARHLIGGDDEAAETGELACIAKADLTSRCGIQQRIASIAIPAALQMNQLKQ